MNSTRLFLSSCCPVDDCNADDNIGRHQKYLTVHQGRSQHDNDNNNNKQKLKQDNKRRNAYINSKSAWTSYLERVRGGRMQSTRGPMAEDVSGVIIS